MRPAMSLRHRIRGLYGIADAQVRPELSLWEKTRLFAEGGASCIQLRDKRGGARALFEAAREALEHLGDRVLILINDRPDVALASGAHGVHVGAEDLPVAVVRKMVGPERIVGATVRTLAEARAALEDGADYVGFGPVFPTSTKALAVEVRGLSMLAEVARGAGLPVVAIGGVGAASAAAIAGAGAAAGAVVSDVLGAVDPVAQARRFTAEFARGQGR